MKKFEFRLSRVLEFRQQEAGLEQTRLSALLSRVKSLEEEKNLLQNQLVQARDEAAGDSQLTGSALGTLAQFERHVSDRSVQLDRERTELQYRISEQRRRVMEAERRVNLLLKLKDRKKQAWTREEDRELESAAADSYMAKLAAHRRSAAGRQDLTLPPDHAVTAE